MNREAERTAILLQREPAATGYQGLILVVLGCSLLCSCWEKRENSWSFQGARLASISSLFWTYRKSHNQQWPVSWNDLKNEADRYPSYKSRLYFTDPETGSKDKWLVFDPSKQSLPIGKKRFIAAAPIVGGNLPERKLQRMVLVETGAVHWVDENEFQAIVNTGK
jgi:hypothetical protein